MQVSPEGLEAALRSTLLNAGLPSHPTTKASGSPLAFFLRYPAGLRGFIGGLADFGAGTTRVRTVFRSLRGDSSPLLGGGTPARESASGRLRAYRTPPPTEDPGSRGAMCVAFVGSPRYARMRMIDPLVRRRR